MGLMISKNYSFPNFFLSSFLPEKFCAKLFPVQINSMVSMVSRSGRHLQRYNGGCRQVVGCIPYRYTKREGFSSVEEIEVLLISSQKGQAMMFPKGGWEIDESMEDAASRETLEEAGIKGTVESSLGKWRYDSKRGCISHEGYMFPMLVKEELEDWPEKNLRKRKWMSVAQASEVCQSVWMKEALKKLVDRQNQLIPSGLNKNETLWTCS